MVKYRDELSYTTIGKKVSIIILAILLITSGIIIINLIPGNLGASNDSSVDESNAEPRSISRGIRTIDFDMNLSRQGRHQKMTVYGSLDTSPIECMAIGDVNGDNHDDLVIGIPDSNQDIRVNVGKVYVITGTTFLPNSYELEFHTNFSIIGANSGDRIGTALAIGNFNGDKYDDIIVGAADSDAVHIFYGGPYLKTKNTWDLASEQANVTFAAETLDSFGASIAVGNITSDKYDDLVIGAPTGNGPIPPNDRTNCGEVWVIEGLDINESIDLNAPPVYLNYSHILGRNPADEAGTFVGSGGDLNGDGEDDVVITAPNGGGPAGNPKVQAGEVYVLDYTWMIGNQSTWDLDDLNFQANFTLYGNFSNDHLGLSPVVYGDINSDGWDDFIVGAPDAQDKGFGLNTGSAYVIRGGTYKPEPYSWDLSFQAANTTIAFQDSNDKAGTWVDTFDWNADNVDDIIITAPSAFGPQNMYQDIGEAVIINGSQNLGSFIDLEIAEPGFYFFGADINDNLGGFSSHGDLDDDGIPDLAIFASGADGLNNAIQDAGEIYIIPGALTFAPSISTLKLRNGGGVSNTTCYAKYMPYEFEVNVSTPLGIADLTNATFTIDPNGLDLTYHWDRLSDSFTEVNDPNNYTEITSTIGNSTFPDLYNWSLNFNIEFNWTFPTRNIMPIKVEIFSGYGYEIMRTFQNVFNVENRLNFTGNLTVKDSNQRELNNNDWVKGDESLSWSGLKVIYEETVDVYPNANEYEVILWNATDSWPAADQEGANISIATNAGPDSLAMDIYSINITGIPLANDLSNITFQLRIDADDIDFSAPLPDAAVWQTEADVLCGVTTTDIGGTQVNGSSIQYRYSNNNGTVWSNWMSAGISTMDDSIDVTKTIHFEDGPENLVQWRGNDTIGNGYSNSPDYMLKVDTANVTFFNYLPEEGQTFNTLSVNFSIEVKDNTSGVDASTIEYAYSVDDGGNWTNWLNLGLSGINGTFKANTSRSFELGSGNLVKWRAKDSAGNGPAESKPLRIKIFIESTELYLDHDYPDNNSVIGNATPKLRWVCNDKSDNIVYDVFFGPSVDQSKVVEQKTSVMIADGISDDFLIIEDPLDDGGIYYWLVIPRNKTGRVGISNSGVWSFKIDLNESPDDPDKPKEEIPKITLLYPTNNQEVNSLKPHFIWELDFTKPKDLLYIIELGKSVDNLDQQVIAISATEYTWTEYLDNLTTYYWRIGVYGGVLNDTHWSMNWSFKTNVKVGEELPDFSVRSSETTLELKQGDGKTLKITVTSLKTYSISVNITVRSSKLPLTIFTLSTTNVKLTQFDDQKSLDLLITIPTNQEANSYQISVEGRVDDIIPIIRSAEITINVTEKGGGGDGDGDGGTSTADDKVMSMGMFDYDIIIILIVVIIVIFVLLLIMRKKKPEEEEEPTEPVEPPLEPGVEEGAPAPMAPPAAPVAPAAAPVAPAAPAAEAAPEEPVSEAEGEPVSAEEPQPVGEPVPIAPTEETPAMEGAAETPALPPATETPPADVAEPEMPTEDLPSDAVEQPAEPAVEGEAPPAPAPTEPAPAETAPAAAGPAAATTTEPAQPAEAESAQTTETEEAKVEEKPKEEE